MAQKAMEGEKFFDESLAQNRKRLYLCSANEAGQGHSPAGLERCSHIAEVIGSNPIVPTSSRERGGCTTMERPPFSFYTPVARPPAGRKASSRHAPHTATPPSFRQRGPPYPQPPLSPLTDAARCVGRCSALREPMQRDAWTDAARCVDRCSTMREPMQRDAMNVQPRLDDGRGASRQNTRLPRPTLTVRCASPNGAQDSRIQEPATRPSPPGQSAERASGAPRTQPKGQPPRHRHPPHSIPRAPPPPLKPHPEGAERTARGEISHVTASFFGKNTWWGTQKEVPLHAS